MPQRSYSVSDSRINSELRVGFNCYLLTAPQTRGWIRYTVNLLAKLPDSGVRPILYSNGPIHENHLRYLPSGSFEVRASACMRYSAWQNFWLPRQLRSDRVDLIHSPMNYGLPLWAPCPKVLTLHDAIDQVYYHPKTPWRKRIRPASLRSRFEHWTARRFADHIITVSYHAKDDLVRHLGLSPDNVSVIYEATDPKLLEVVQTEEARLMGPAYFFYVGGLEDRKNIPFLFEAFAAAKIPGVELRLAGGRENEQSELQALATELGISDRVRFLGFVADHELAALYQRALAFVYPSKYEGFGLQLVEAMSLGTPVLAARATCLPEILGDGGDTFSLDNVDELVAELTKIAGEPAYRAELSTRGLQRSAAFSWDNAAQETAAVYHRVLRINLTPRTR